MTNKQIAETFTNEGYEGIKKLHEKQLDKVINRSIIFIIFSFIAMVIFFSAIVKGIYTKAELRNETNKILLEKLSADCKIKCDSAISSNSIIINK